MHAFSVVKYDRSVACRKQIVIKDNNAVADFNDEVCLALLAHATKDA